MRTWSNCILTMACILSLGAGCSRDSGGTNTSEAAKGESAYAISGKVVTGDGKPLADVTLSLSGNHSGTTTTDTSGNYRFTDLANGDYIISPSRAGYLFSPATQSVTLRGADGVDVDFAASSAATGLNMWTWVMGDRIINHAGVYGIPGVAADTNRPGARVDSAGWADSRDQLWLFGGFGYGGATPGYLNDLWKFDGTQWTWVSGESQADQAGVYGIRKVAADTNMPGGRCDSTSWKDSQGNLWLFGGWGYDGTGAFGCLNDLWKYDGARWTWIAGDSWANQAGVYGTRGAAAGSNKPGARVGAVSWIDNQDNLWLFGGAGYDVTGSVGNLNDLWKFDGATWTWIAGDSWANQAGVYGTRGVAGAANKPGARVGAVAWTDSQDNLWLFGGEGSTGTQAAVFLNDLWKFDGAAWTWIAGDSWANQAGVYGVRGKAADSNNPGARYDGISWTDSHDNLWLFGGVGIDGSGALGNLNDLWRFEP